MPISKTLVRYLLFACLGMLLLSFVAACKKKEESGMSSDKGMSRSEAPAPAAYAPASAEAPAADQVVASPEPAKRKIILAHELNLEVASLATAVETITKLAESSGGYVFSSSRSSQDKNSFSGEIGIRVPSGKSGGVLTGIRKMGRVERENSTAEDITEGYVDMEARLKNAQASEARLKQMYQRAGNIKDVLEVEKELTRVRGDIEAFMAKKRNWDVLTEMVTIKIELHESSASLPSSHRFWNPIASAFGEALEGLSGSLHALIVFVGVLLPWIVILVPLVYLMTRRMRNKPKNKLKMPGKTGGQDTSVANGESRD